MRFVIDRTGTAQNPQDDGSDLPDGSVVQCVLRGFGKLVFPRPAGGAVTTVSAIQFSPGT